MTNSKDIDDLISQIRNRLNLQTQQKPSNETTNEVKTSNKILLHKTDNGNYSWRQNKDGMLPRHIFDELIAGDKDTKILRSFPSGNVFKGKPQYIRYIRSENMPQLEKICKKHGIKIEMV